MKLSDTIGKTISDFCSNQFIDAADNHCAHYVCHVLQVTTGYTCKAHTGGSGPAACLRVHELFAASPQVGNWSEAPADMCMVFVTDKSNVDLVAHTMRNVPKKHVGILSGGQVYNYGNTVDKVVIQSPADFLARFQSSYGGKQALFHGTFPPGSVIPDPEDDGAAAPAPVAIAAPASGPVPVIRAVTAGGKTDYYATLPSHPEFYVARGVKHADYRGLFQPGSKQEGPRYLISDYKPQYETVAGLLGVIAAGESSGYFNRLNSYDRAAFTFGFFQLAAHTPNDNLILLFRRLAGENALFQRLFPDLKLVNGVLHQLVGSHTVSLEKEYPRPNKPSELNLRDLMAYLNPDGATVDEKELSVAAKMVFLANNDALANGLQVNVAAQITMGKMRNYYAVWYDLDGVSDLICTAIADIHHQGRGAKTQVRAALASSNTVAGKLRALCRIGEADYASRCETLRQALAQAEQNGDLGTTVFDKASGLFRPAGGWPE